MNAWYSVRIAETREKPSGRLRGAFPPASASNVSLSRSVNSNNVGSGVSKTSAMASMILSEGLALPLVRSLKNEIDMPALLANSCFVMPSSSSRRRMFVKSIWLYTAKTIPALCGCKLAAKILDGELMFS